VSELVAALTPDPQLRGHLPAAMPSLHRFSAGALGHVGWQNLERKGSCAWRSSSPISWVYDMHECEVDDAPLSPSGGKTAAHGGKTDRSDRREMIAKGHC